MNLPPNPNQEPDDDILADLPTAIFITTLLAILGLALAADF